MSLTFTTQKTPKDRTFIRTVSSGTVTVDDTSALMAAIAPGTPLANAPILSIIEPGSDYTPEARKSFSVMGNTAGGQVAMPVAIVVPNAAMRVLISFILKIAGAAGTTKFFATESDAKQWLFGVVDV